MFKVSQLDTAVHQDPGIYRVLLARAPPSSQAGAVRNIMATARAFSSSRVASRPTAARKCASVLPARRQLVCRAQQVRSAKTVTSGALCFTYSAST
jgi:hypothetical protein